MLVYNAVGQKLIEKQLTKNITSLNNQLSSGAYIVSVLNAEKLITNKIIIK